MQKNHKNPPSIWLKILIPVILFSLTPLIANAGYSIRNSNPSVPGQGNIFNFTMQPGDKQQGTVKVINLTSNPTDIMFYGADAVSSTVSFSASSYNDKQNTIGKWLIFNPNTITLQPRETRDIPFTIQLPASTPPGIYAGAIAASSLPQGTSNAQNNTMGINVLTRIILKVYVTVPGTATFSYEWKDFSFLEDRNPYLNLTLKNKGNTVINVEGNINIYNNGTTSQPIATIPIELSQIYQGDTITIKKLFDTTLASNIFNNFTAVAKINIGKLDVISGKNTENNTLTKETSFSLNKIYLLFGGGAILLLIILVIAFIIIRKRSIIKNATRYTVRANDTLDLISKQTGASWKAIAGLNKLKPPYGLKAGKIILIPKTRNKK